MNNNSLQCLVYDTTRGIVLTTRGEEVQVKEHRGWKYVNYDGRKIGLSKIPVRAEDSEDPVFDYVFKGGYEKYPCPAMDYWIYRHRMGRKITPAQYKLLKFNK